MNHNTDKKYTEILHEEKKERMNWDFEDFLKKAEETEKTQLPKKSTGRTLPKIYWMAASLVLLMSVFFGYQVMFKDHIKETGNLVRTEIERQKSQENAGQLAQNAVAVAAKDSLKSNEKDSVREVNQAQEKDVLDQILPKRGRMKRSLRARYVKNFVKPAHQKLVMPQSGEDRPAKPEYSENYVIINGQKITSEKEAIDITKYSFQILASNVNQTVEQTDVIKNLNIDF